MTGFECHGNALESFGLYMADNWRKGEIWKCGPLKAYDTVLGVVGEGEGDLTTSANWDATKVELVVLSSCKNDRKININYS